MAVADDAAAQIPVRAILQLIDCAVSALADDESSIGLACESQARAAQAALQQVVADRTAPPGVQTSPPPGARILNVRDNAASLLAAAERQLAALPADVRNQVPMCAAAIYLRHARRALATP